MKEQDWFGHPVIVKCPECRKAAWKVADWGGYLAVNCTTCLYQIGQIQKGDA